MAQLPGSRMAGTGPVDVDGVSMWSAIQAGTASPRTEMVHNIDGHDEKGAWSGVYSGLLRHTIARAADRGSGALASPRVVLTSLMSPGSIRVGDLKLLVGFPGYPDGHVRPAVRPRTMNHRLIDNHAP